MEKLLEVLIAIGDEVACLSVSQLILRHWPSHSRALRVKQVIEESEPTPFAPRGIDKLEPHHVRLKFLDKRKATSDDLNDSSTKRLNQDITLHLPEASWTALAGELLGILMPLNGNDPKNEAHDLYRSADVRLIIHLPSSSDNVVGKQKINNNNIENKAVEHTNTDTILDEPHQERRSSRLRSRKPDKEETDITAPKDLVKLVPQFLEPFIMVESETTESSEIMTDTQSNESVDVARFVSKTSNNRGAYHIGHLLLEEIASRGVSHRDTFAKFLELEVFLRNSGETRTPECSLFLAELAYDFGMQSSPTSASNDFMSMASYHLCKVIESVALDYPTDDSSIGSLLDNKRAFWARFFWLSGKFSIFNGDKEKAQKEFGVLLALFTSHEKGQNVLGSISLPHLKVLNELTVDLVLHEINLTEVDFLMKNTVNDMIEKDMYSECISLLYPLLFPKDDGNVSAPSALDKDGDELASTELSALNVIIKACEKSKTADPNIYLKCHKQKLRYLMAAIGVEERFGSHKSSDNIESTETLNTGLHPLLSEEIKAISQCTLELKNSTSPSGSIVS